MLGVAGLAGVAATGVLVARDQRQRGSYSPDEIRARLQARAAADASAPPPTSADHEPGVAAEPTETRRGRLLGRLPRRFTRQRPDAIH
ncbi:hypothetical protein FF36_05074 [Frankia torreyi]|uniref:Uncharacterized protein n=2 Tax=Frankia TaxID=1854 RepID=A0A0D8B8M8_9ACTN|nr:MULTISPECIES: hypothetical protein [Frankia]KJE20648.1 hypothetical protein FF36_05074 [Frankia torreyi]